MTRNSALLLLAATSLGLGCGGGGTGPNPPPPPPPAAVVASVVVTPGADTLTALGQTRQLAAVAKDAAGTIISGKTFVWTSAAPTTVSIDAASGLATAVGNGQATLTASVDGKSGQALLLVDQQVGSVEISPTSGGATSLGAVTQFSAVAKDASGTPIAGTKFLWVSSDPSVATVDSTGKVTAKGPGVATISVAGRGVPANAVFTVTQLATQLAITVQPPSSTEGRQFPGAVQVEIHDANGALVTGARMPVFLSVGTNPSLGGLGGATIVNSVGGVATFSGLAINRAGLGYTLVANAASLTPATTDPFDVFLDFVQVDAGNAETCGATASGAVYCWGWGDSGRIGDGATIDRLVPTRVLTPPGVRFVKAIVGNPAPTCALTNTGAAYCWGIGSLGNTATNNSPLPVLVALPAGVTLVTLDVGGSHACGTSPGGQIYCWGSNGSHELGDGTTSTRVTPVPATLPAGILFTSATATGNASCALSSLGTGYCWGNNTVGQVGNGTTTPVSVPTPVTMPAGQTFTWLQTTAASACGLTFGGVLYCWGANGNGELGDGTNVPHSLPATVVMPAGVSFTRFAGTSGFGCAIATTGVMYCWGANGNGYLGDGTTTAHLTPQPVTMPAGVTFTDVSADGSGHVCAVAAGGAVYCWGFNPLGELGDGTLITRLVPTRVAR